MRTTTIMLLMVFALTASAQQRKKIYLAPDDHTDYMSTADEAGYLNAMLSMLDYWLTCQPSSSSSCIKTQ